MKLENYSTQEILDELEARANASFEPEPEVDVPMELEFTVYVHHDYTRNEWHEYIENVTNYALSDELVTKIMNAFYEVGIPTKINTKTGKVTAEVKIDC